MTGLIGYMHSTSKYKAGDILYRENRHELAQIREVVPYRNGYYDLQGISYKFYDRWAEPVHIIDDHKYIRLATEAEVILYREI